MGQPQRAALSLRWVGKLRQDGLGAYHQWERGWVGSPGDFFPPWMRERGGRNLGVEPHCHPATRTRGTWWTLKICGSFMVSMTGLRCSGLEVLGSWVTAHVLRRWDRAHWVTRMGMQELGQPPPHTPPASSQLRSAKSAPCLMGRGVSKQDQAPQDGGSTIGPWVGAGSSRGEWEKSQVLPSSLAPLPPRSPWGLPTLLWGRPW